VAFYAPSVRKRLTMGFAVLVLLTKMPDVESKEAIAARLKVMRLALGFETQAALAKAVGSGITQQRWNNYESGRHRLALNVALVICHKFPQVTLDWLYRAEKGTLRRFFSAEIDEAERFVRRLSHRTSNA
jgi:DNA-binding XRE family transcriptional regulator